MLTINGTSVDVVGLPAVASWTGSRRLGRLRVVDGDERPDAMPADCRPEGKPMCDQRVFRGSNFARSRPEPRVSARREPSAALRRKLLEARARLLWRAGVAGDGSRRADVQVQCIRMAEPGRRGTVATQTTAAATAQTYLSCASPHLQSFPVVKCKTGLDAGTQVTANDLMDGDAETSRLAEPMVAGALERAAIAVLYEDDGAACRAERSAYEALRHADLVELRAFEYRETSRRHAGLRVLAAAECSDPGPAFRAVHGHALARVYATTACADALDQIAAAGYLTEDIALDGQLHGRIRDSDQTRDLLHELIGDTIVNRRARFAHNDTAYRSDHP